MSSHVTSAEQTQRPLTTELCVLYQSLFISPTDAIYICLVIH